MKSKISKIRAKFFENSEFDEEALEELKGIPTYKIFKPDKLTVKFEQEREQHDVGFSYVDDIEDSSYQIFLIGTNEEEISELTPVEAFIRYEVENPNYPQYPGGDYELDIHDSEVVDSIENLEKYNVTSSDFYFFCASDFLSLKVRGEITEI